MIKHMQITETDSAVHFECHTQKWVCTNSKCQREYERPREMCLGCENIKFKFSEDKRFGYIVKNAEKWGCSCIFGSWFRWGNFWLNNYPEVKCKHYQRAFRQWNKIKKIKREANNAVTK